MDQIITPCLIDRRLYITPEGWYYKKSIEEGTLGRNDLREIVGKIIYAKRKRIVAENAFGNRMNYSGLILKLRTRNTTEISELTSLRDQGINLLLENYGVNKATELKGQNIFAYFNQKNELVAVSTIKPE